MFGIKPKLKFNKNQYEEYEGPINNPARGFYHMYRISLSEDMDLSTLDDSLLGTGSLILLELILTGYNRTEIDEAGIERAHNVFKYFVSKSKYLIVRYVYDVEGKGLENEPNRFSLVENHMKALGPVTLKYDKNVLVVQGVFVGSWGEMHTSKFLTEEYLKKLVKIWNTSTEGAIPLALRRPDFIRMCVGYDGEVRKEYENFAFYNDGLFGSDDDLGTYGYVTSMDVVWPGLRTRNEEIEFLDPITDKTPFGGELLSSQFIYNPEFILNEMRALHMCYMNIEYDPVILNRLAQVLAPDDYGVDGHRSMLDYIGDHLGYRFVVRDCELSKNCKELAVYLENAGFSRLFGNGTMGVVLRKEGESAMSVSSPVQLNGLPAGKIAKITFPVPEGLSGEYSVCLEMYYNSIHPIRPANVGADVVFELGTINAK